MYKTWNITKINLYPYFVNKYILFIYMSLTKIYLTSEIIEFRIAKIDVIYPSEPQDEFSLYSHKNEEKKHLI